jgi:hypothetical protein
VHSAIPVALVWCGWDNNLIPLTLLAKQWRFKSIEIARKSA